MNFNKYIAAMALALAAGYTPERKPDPLAGIDVEREYQLIQEKKSGLSARLRSMVIARYERNQRGA